MWRNQKPFFKLELTPKGSLFYIYKLPQVEICLLALWDLLWQLLPLSRFVRRALGGGRDPARDALSLGPAASAARRGRLDQRSHGSVCVCTLSSSAEGTLPRRAFLGGSRLLGKPRAVLFALHSPRFFRRAAVFLGGLARRP
jgi:hypothetical protein